MPSAIALTAITTTRRSSGEGRCRSPISTAGHSGALAQRLREELERDFGPEWESWLRWLGEARSSLYDDPLSPRQRRTMLHKLASRQTQEKMFERWGFCPSTKVRRRGIKP